MTPMLSFSLAESLRGLAASEEAPTRATAVVFRNWRRSIACRIGFGSGCLRAGQLADVNVFEPQIVAMVLQLDGAGRINRFIPLPVILQRGVINDQFVVQEDVHLFAKHQNAKAVPFADRFVRK